MVQGMYILEPTLIYLLAIRRYNCILRQQTLNKFYILYTQNLSLDQKLKKICKIVMQATDIKQIKIIIHFLKKPILFSVLLKEKLFNWKILIRNIFLLNFIFIHKINVILVFCCR